MPFVLKLDDGAVSDIDLRRLAHLGDAVFELYERELELLPNPSSKKMHDSVVSRVNARSQAKILENLMPHLNESEAYLVKRARNLKTSGYKKIDQNIYRYATAFEALIGYLYLSDQNRMIEILQKTRESEPS